MSKGGWQIWVSRRVKRFNWLFDFSVVVNASSGFCMLSVKVVIQPEIGIILVAILG